MNNDRWWIWVVVAILFMVFRGLRGLMRGEKKAVDGMARMNAAAERILKQRAGDAVPSSKPGAQPKAGSGKPRPQSAPLKPTSTPAVIRRDGLLASGREPVIQRRR